MTRVVRIVLVAAALLAATFVIQGQIAGKLPGQVRLQAPDASLVAPGTADQAHPDTAPAQRPASVVAPNAARIDVSTRAAAKASTGYVLEATVRTPAGNAAPDATVKFYELVDLLGAREMLIGAATTDGSGRASLVYLPARTGVHDIVVRSSGIAKVAPGETRTTLDAAVAAAPYRVEAPALSGFHNVVPYGVGVVVLTVWLLIAFALIGTALGVARGARNEKEKGVIA